MKILASHIPVEGLTDEQIDQRVKDDCATVVDRRWNAIPADAKRLLGLDRESDMKVVLRRWFQVQFYHAELLATLKYIQRMEASSRARQVCDCSSLPCICRPETWEGDA